VPMVSKSIRVARSIEDLADLLGSRPGEWLVPFASIAVHSGEAAAARRSGMTIGAGPRRVRRISIDLTDVPQADDAERIDAGVQWETSGFRWVFQSFDGRIVATRLADDSCAVSIEGSFRPAASTGEDAEAVSTAAETAVAMLLSTVREAIEEQARAGV
jgi:hypothetical protein